MYVFGEHQKKKIAWRDWSINWRRYSTNWNAYSLATVNISSYAVLITWPRYNNMDYSYPRFSAWCDASRGKGFLSSLVSIKHVASEIQCYGAVMLRHFRKTTTRCVIQLRRLVFSCALITESNKGTTARTFTDFMEILKKFQPLAPVPLFKQKEIFIIFLINPSLKQWSSGLIRSNYLTADQKKNNNPKWGLDWKLLAIHTTLKSMKISACSLWV